MNTDCVLVFVDALPYEEYRRLGIAEKGLTWVQPVQPGFGYSVNVKA